MTCNFHAFKAPGLPDVSIPGLPSISFDIAISLPTIGELTAGLARDAGIIGAAVAGLALPSMKIKGLPDISIPGIPSISFDVAITLPSIGELTAELARDAGIIGNAVAGLALPSMKLKGLPDISIPSIPSISFDVTLDPPPCPLD